MPLYGCIARNVSLHFVIVYALFLDDRQAGIQATGGVLKAGALEHRIAARMPMTAIAQANEFVEPVTPSATSSSRSTDTVARGRRMRWY